MDKQFNITIPEATMQLIEQTMPQENLNQLINKAINFYIKQNLSENLKEELRIGAIDRAERDLKLAKEWCELEEEAWQEINQ
jgi:CopG family transcriptional regulator/antitoxin EndoAI